MLEDAGGPLSPDVQFSTIEEALQHMVVDATTLLKMPYKNFWSTVAYDDSLPVFLDSFLRVLSHIFLSLY